MDPTSVLKAAEPGTLIVVVLTLVGVSALAAVACLALRSVVAGLKVTTGAAFTPRHIAAHPPAATASHAHGPGTAATAPAPTASSALEASGLTRDDIEDIQRALGMDERFVTGRLDATTRGMIERFQRSVGRRPTGFLTPILIERLFALTDR